MKHTWVRVDRIKSRKPVNLWVDTWPMPFMLTKENLSAFKAVVNIIRCDKKYCRVPVGYYQLAGKIYARSISVGLMTNMTNKVCLMLKYNVL